MAVAESLQGGGDPRCVREQTGYAGLDLAFAKFRGDVGLVSTDVRALDGQLYDAIRQC